MGGKEGMLLLSPGTFDYLIIYSYRGKNIHLVKNMSGKTDLTKISTYFSDEFLPDKVSHKT